MFGGSPENGFRIVLFENVETLLPPLEHLDPHQASREYPETRRADGNKGGSARDDDKAIAWKSDQETKVESH